MKEINYAVFHYHIGHWAGFWSAQLAEFAKRGKEVTKMAMLVNQMAAVLNKKLSALNIHVLDKDVLKKPVYPSIIAKSPYADAIVLGATLGIDEAIETAKHIYGSELYEEGEFTMMMENFAHLDRLKKAILPNDAVFDMFYKFLTEECKPGSREGRIATASLLTTFLEIMAWELNQSQRGKRIINEDGFYEFVEYDHPTPVDDSVWDKMENTDE